MFKVLCKIWQFVVKILKMVVDGVAEILGFVLKTLIELGSNLWGALFGSGGLGLKGILLLAGLGLAAWWAWGLYSDNKEKEEDRDFQREIARTYATGGAR